MTLTVACTRLVMLVAYTSRCVLFPGWQASSAQHSGRYGPEGQLPEAYRLWFFWEMTSMSFCIQRSAWFDSGYMHCVSLRSS